MINQLLTLIVVIGIFFCSNAVAANTNKEILRQTADFIFYKKDASSSFDNVEDNQGELYCFTEGENNIKCMGEDEAMLTRVMQRTISKSSVKPVKPQAIHQGRNDVSQEQLNDYFAKNPNQNTVVINNYYDENGNLERRSISAKSVSHNHDSYHLPVVYNNGKSGKSFIR